MSLELPTSSAGDSEMSKMIILGVTAAFCCVIVVCGVVYLTVQRLRNKRLSNEREREGAIFCVKTFEEGNIDGLNPNLTMDEQADLLPYDQKYEFPRDNLQIGQQLGTGAFGVVYKAKAKGIIPDQEETTVAVKTVKSIAGYEVSKTKIE